uniref:Uncharacterized protein n=1 Tax=Glossina pallidipes TaxID=7398 RepID=A0A1B0A7L0_GLOPL
MELNQGPHLVEMESHPCMLDIQDWFLLQSVSSVSSVIFWAIVPVKFASWRNLKSLRMMENIAWKADKLVKLLQPVNNAAPPPSILTVDLTSSPYNPYGFPRFPFEIFPTESKIIAKTLAARVTVRSCSRTSLRKFIRSSATITVTDSSWICCARHLRNALIGLKR